MKIEDIIRSIERITNNHKEALNSIKALQKKYAEASNEELTLIIEQSKLRVKATHKFTLAEKMIFTAKALEQCTSEALSHYTASLFQKPKQLLEICSGIGGNSIGLAKTCPELTCIESNPLLQTIHLHNLSLYPINHINRLTKKADVSDAKNHDGIFIDPDRRSNGRRIFDPNDLSPDLNFINSISKKTNQIIVKMSPMLSIDDTPEDFSVHYVAEEMELKQCLWLGNQLKKDSAEFTIISKGNTYTSNNLIRPNIDPQNKQQAIFEFNPAISKSWKLDETAEYYNKGSLNFKTNHFIGEAEDLYPLANSWIIIEEHPYHPKKISQILKNYGASRYEFKCSGLDNNEIKKLFQKWGSGKGDATTIFIFKLKDYKKIIISKRYSKKTPL